MKTSIPLMAILSTTIALTACSGGPISSTPANASTNHPNPTTSTSTNTAAGNCVDDYFRGSQPRLTNSKMSAQTRQLCFSSYSVLHSGVTRTPLWAGEHLTAGSVMANVDRKDSFHAETRLPAEERAELADYSQSGYDRGHLAPAADMPTPEAMHESFSLANMTPQNPTNNRGLWSNIEEATRNLAKQRGEIFVVSGPIFAGTSLKRINNRVLVPTNYFKAIYDANTGESGAYLVNNDATKTYKIVSINELVQTAGVDPFPSISATSKRTAMALPTP